MMWSPRTRDGSKRVRMIFEIVLLALASTVRPTSLAAVSTLLARDSRRRLMIAYVACGLAFTFMFGVVVVGAFHGVHLQSGTSRTQGIADTVGGVVVLLFGLAVQTGVVPQRLGHTDEGAATNENNKMAWFDREITVRVAAAAGPLTHIPGIFYLVALNLIVAHNPELPGGLIAVAIYNGVWFAVPIAALVICLGDPEVAQNVVVAVQETAKRHSRTIILVTCFVVGTALLIRGVRTM